MADIKLIVTDLDGTFFGDGYDVPQQNIEAVKAAQKAGITVCACSARLWGMGHHMVKKGGFDRWGVFNNGAAIADAMTGEIAHKIGIAPEYFRELIEAAASFDAVIQSWNHEFIGIYGPTMGERGRISAQRMSDPNAEVHCPVRIYDSIEDMDEGCRDIAQKIMLFMDSVHMPKVIENLSKVCDIEVTSSHETVVEVTMPGATKGDGVKKLAKMYGVDAKNIMAIGDNFNDVGMLEFAGVKVAIGNAKDSLKRIAQHVVANNVDAGFAQAVHEIVLKS